MIYSPTLEEPKMTHINRRDVMRFAGEGRGGYTSANAIEVTPNAETTADKFYGAVEKGVHVLKGIRYGESTEGKNLFAKLPLALSMLVGMFLIASPLRAQVPARIRTPLGVFAHISIE